MDINRVIYFNELSDHVEQCFRSEVSNGNSLKIKGQEFTTSMIARRVYIDGKYIYITLMRNLQVRPLNS